MSSETSALAVPCDADRVLQSVCQQCHSNPTQNSAPFPLVTYADTQTVSNGQPVWQYMRTVVASGAMPLPPVQITAADRDTLTRWLNSGAPARTVTDTCNAVANAMVDSGSDFVDPTLDSDAPNADGSGQDPGPGDAGVSGDSDSDADDASPHSDSDPQANGDVMVEGSPVSNDP